LSEHLAVYIALGGFLMTVIGLVYQHFGVIMKLQQQISDVKGEVDELKVKVEPFWNLVEKNLPQLLMHLTTKEKDILLAKLSSGDLPLDEAYHLRAILMEDCVSPTANPQLIVARLLVMARLQQRITEMNKKKETELVKGSCLVKPHHF